jgi:hypothetical protein
MLIAKIADTIFSTQTQKCTFHRGNDRRFEGLGARDWVEKMVPAILAITTCIYCHDCTCIVVNLAMKSYLWHVVIHVNIATALFHHIHVTLPIFVFLISGDPSLNNLDDFPSFLDTELSTDDLMREFNTEVAIHRLLSTFLIPIQH